MNNKIAGIVISYNPNMKIIETINSIISQVDKVIIVDNGSNENGIDILKKIKNNNESIHIIYNNNNLGIATALNIGVKYAEVNNYDWVLTMDQDSKASVNMIGIMLNTYEKLKKDEKIQILSIFPNFIDESVQSIQEICSDEEYGYVDADITSGNLIRIDAFKKIGYFDDTLFIDMVDTDFCMRLNQANIKMIKVKTALLYHKLGDGKRVKTPLGNFNTSNHSALRRYYMTRNRLYTWRKYKNLKSFTLNRDKKLFVKEFIKIILGEDYKIEKIKMIFKGYIHYKRGIRGKL